MPSSSTTGEHVSSTGRWILVVADRRVLLRRRSSPGFVAFESILTLSVGVVLAIVTTPWLLPPYVIATGLLAFTKLRGVKRFEFVRGDLLVFRPVMRWIGLRPRRLKRPHAVRTRRDWPGPRHQGTSPIHVVEIRDDDGNWRVVEMIQHEGDAMLIESLLRRACAESNAKL